MKLIIHYYLTYLQQEYDRILDTNSARAKSIWVFMSYIFCNFLPNLSLKVCQIENKFLNPTADTQLVDMSII